MDVLTLSRAQFALTIMFHYLFPPLSIGLGALMVLMEAMYLWTGDARYHAMTRFWTRIFAVNFAMGVATGIVMEFEFGTNWAEYARYVGDVFGSALATFLFGALVGNCLHGMPLGADGDVVRPLGFFELFGLYPTAIGLFAVATFAMHGSIYLYLKTEGELQKRIHGWMWTTFGIFLVHVHPLHDPHDDDEPAVDGEVPRLPVAVGRGGAERAGDRQHPAGDLTGQAVLRLRVVVRDDRGVHVPVRHDAVPEHDRVHGRPGLQPDRGARRRRRRRRCGSWLGVALLGMPFVLTYTATIYWVFRGKVRVGKFSY